MSDLLDYKCPACGGAMEFDAATQKMKCPFCDSVFDVSEPERKDEAPDRPASGGPNQESPADNTWKSGEDEGMGVFICKSCGGEIVGDENTASTSCPYCGNPVVMVSRLSGMLKPDCVIPFKLDKKAAKDKLKQYVSTKKFAPSSFRSDNRLDEIKGVYVPFWLFDSTVSASAKYEGTKVRTWTDNRYEFTETSYFDIYRQGTMAFENVPVDGSKSMPEDLMESIEPFDFKDAVDFKTAYLAGYLADKYDISMEESSVRANDRIKRSAESTLRNTVSGFASLVPKDCSIQQVDGGVKYALYPVWLLNTNYGGKKYTFAMNGQTGKLVGDLPTSKGKLWGMFFGLTAGIAAVAFIIGKLLGWA